MTHPIPASSWIGASVATGIGVVAGIIGSWWALRRDRQRHAFTIPNNSPTSDDIASRLEQQLAQLRELDAARDKLDPASYATERATLVQHAANSMRIAEALRTTQNALAPTPHGHYQATMTPRQSNADDDHGNATPAIGFLRARPQLRGALWGGGIVGAAMFLYFTVQDAQHPRASSNAMPMPQAAADTGNGSNATTAGHPQEAESESITQLTQWLTDHPEDTDALAKLSHKLLRAMMLNEAGIVNERLLKLNPNHPEGKIHAAVLRASQGNGEQADALRDLTALVTADPTLHEAWFFRGMLSMQAGDMATMKESFEGYLKHAPPGPQRDRVRNMLEKAH